MPTSKITWNIVMNHAAKRLIERRFSDMTQAEAFSWLAERSRCAHITREDPDGTVHLRCGKPYRLRYRARRDGGDLVLVTVLSPFDKY